MKVKNKDLVKGKEYLVGDCNDRLISRKFLAINSNDKPVFESRHSGEYVSTWKTIQEIKQDEPWPYETCPLPPFTVKKKASGHYSTITSIGKNYVWFTGVRCTYKTLLEQYLYIPDRNDRANEVICGVTYD